MITIAHLYYDLLNLYGENGNIIVLKRTLKEQGIKVNLKLLSLEDDFNFNEYDFVYIGTGTENNQLIALNHLKKYTKDIKKYIEEKKVFLATGNSIEMFGKSIDNIKGLNIFKYNVESLSNRLVTETLLKNDNFTLIGFQNQSKNIINNPEPWFTVLKGDQLNTSINYNNFYGTYLIGPLLVRNPHFLEFLVKQTIINKNKSFKFKKFNLKLDYLAYNNFLNTFYKDLQ